MNAFLASVGGLLLRFRTGTSGRARLARASAWMLVGSASQQLFLLVSSIAAAHLLGQSGFGELGLVRSTTTFFAGVMGAGVSVAATRYVAALRVEDPERAGRVLGVVLTIAWTVGLAATLLCAALAPVIAARSLHAPQLALPIAICGITVVFVVVGGVLLGILTGLERFESVAALTLAEGLAIGMLTVIGAWLAAVTGAVIGQTVAMGIIFACKQMQVTRACRQASIRVTTAGMRGELRVIGAFVLPTVILGVATQPAEWFSRVLLARQPQGVAEMAVFTVAFSWAQLIVFIPGQLAGPMIPLLSGRLADGDAAAFRSLLRHAIGLVFLTAATGAIVVAALSPLIMRAYGSGFVHGASTLVILAFGYAIGAVTMVFRAALFAVEKAWLQTAQAAVAGVVLITTFLIWRDLGASGLALSYAAMFVVVTPMQAVVMKRHFKPVARQTQS